MIDYRQKYEDALERAKSLVGLEDEIGIIFPELRECDDNKIRKGLITHLKELKEKSVEGSFLKRQEHYDGWISWLEKQHPDDRTSDFDRGYAVGASAERYNRWKPTEEQLDALETAISSLQSTSLELLYKDLKQL